LIETKIVGLEGTSLCENKWRGECWKKIFFL